MEEENTEPRRIATRSQVTTVAGAAGESLIGDLEHDLGDTLPPLRPPMFAPGDESERSVLQPEWVGGGDVRQ